MNYRIYLPGTKIPEETEIAFGAQSVRGAGVVLLATPSFAVADACRAMKPYIEPDSLIVNSAKGLEHGSGRRLSELIKEILPGHPVTVLSGPSHAEEVALSMPTAVTAATDDAEAAKTV